MGRKRKDDAPTQNRVKRRKKVTDGESVVATPREETVKMVMNYPEIFHVVRLQGLKNCLDNTALNDFTFLVGPKRKAFNVNRFPMATVSSTIKEKLLALEDGNGDSMELLDVSPRGFRAIVLYAYGHDPEVCPENVVDVAQVARLLNIEALGSECLRFAASVLQKDEAYLMPYLETATTFQNADILKICFNSLQERGGVPAFLSSPAFCSLSADLVNMILRLDQLPVYETTVWETCLKWAEAQAKVNETDQLKELKKVYHNVRFPLCSPMFFSSKVVPTGVLSQKETLSLFQFLTFPAGASDTGVFSKAPRVLWDETEVIRSNGSKPYSGELFHLENYIDGIAFSVDHEIDLTGVGLLLGEGSTKVNMKIFQGQCDERVQVARVRQTVKLPEKGTKAHKIELPAVLRLKKDTIYEIEVESVGACSLKMNSGVQELEETRNGITITFTFSKYKSGTSETNVKKGNIPSLFCSLMSN